MSVCLSKRPAMMFAIMTISLIPFFLSFIKQFFFLFVVSTHLWGFYEKKNKRILKFSYFSFLGEEGKGENGWIVMGSGG